MNFELDTYLDALQDFPRTDTKLHTQRGMATCQKIDIFKRLMWFTYDENPITWHKLSVDSVKEILEINKNGEPIEELEEYAIVTDLSSRKSTSVYEGIELAPVEEDSITRFDTPKRKKNKRNNKKDNKGGQKNAKSAQSNNNNSSKQLKSQSNQGAKKDNNNAEVANEKQAQKPQAKLKNTHYTSGNNKKNPNYKNKQKVNNNDNTPKDENS